MGEADLDSLARDFLGGWPEMPGASDGRESLMPPRHETTRKAALLRVSPLIELSVVLVIIGFIAGAVLAGRDLIHGCGQTRHH